MTSPAVQVEPPCLLIALAQRLDTVAPETLPATHRLVLLCLADGADAEGRCWRGPARIARWCGLSTSAVEVALRELEGAGWIAGQRRWKEGRDGVERDTTMWTICASGGPIARRRSGTHARRNPPVPGTLPLGCPAPQVQETPERRAPHPPVPGTLPLGCPAPHPGLPGNEYPPTDPPTNPPTDPPRRGAAERPPAAAAAGGQLMIAAVESASAPAGAVSPARKPGSETPEGWQQCLDRYRAAWTARKGTAPFSWGPREGKALRDALTQRSPEVMIAAIAGAEANPRWEGDFLTIAANPPRWLGSTQASTPAVAHGVTAEEVAEALALARVIGAESFGVAKSVLNGQAVTARMLSVLRDRAAQSNRGPVKQTGMVEGCAQEF